MMSATILSGGVVLDVLRLGRSRIAALVGCDDIVVAGEVGDDMPPGPVRFGEAVQEDDRRVGGIARDLDVEFDTRRKGDALEVGHSSSPLPQAGGGRGWAPRLPHADRFITSGAPTPNPLPQAGGGLEYLTDNSPSSARPE